MKTWFCFGAYRAVTSPGLMEVFKWTKGDLEDTVSRNYLRLNGMCVLARVYKVVAAQEGWGFADRRRVTDIVTISR